MLITNSEDLCATGRFLHRPQDSTDLTFRDSNGDLRNYQLLLALAETTAEGESDFSQNGITLFDNDAKKIVFACREQQATGLFGPSAKQLEAYGQICDMGWREFSRYVGTAARPDADDIRHPLVKSGALPEVDIRPVSREQAIKALMMSPMVRMQDGKIALGWNISMNFSWDKLGHGDTDREFDASFDKAWLKAMRDDHSILDDACEKALQPYLTDPFTVFECEDMRCNLDVIGAKGDRIVLREFEGHSLEFDGYAAMRETLSAMNNETLGHLWTATQALRSDFSRASRAEMVSSYLYDAREELEAKWQLDHEAELA